MTEAYTTLENTLKFYGKIENETITKYGSHIPFNFELISNSRNDTTAHEYKIIIENWVNGMPKANKIQANWVVSNF